MTLTPAGHVQRVTLWKPSHHLRQSPFPSQRKVRWHFGAEKHQLAHSRTAWVQGAQFMPFGLQLSISAGMLALYIPMRMDSVPWVHPPSTVVSSCPCWVHKHWMPHRKLSPKKPWQKICCGVQQASVLSLVTSLDPEPLPLLPGLGNTTPRVSHTLAPSAGCFRSNFIFFFFQKEAHLL